MTIIANYLAVNFSATTGILALIAIVVSTILLINRFAGLSVHLRGPGPWGIPILGFYPFLRKDYHVHLAELARKYGDVYLINLCGKLCLHLSTLKAMRETFVTKSDAFPGRGQDFSLMNCVLKDGVIYANDDEWKAQRKFLVQSMRELGLGAKEQLKLPLMDSLEVTLKALKDAQGKPLDITTLLSMQCTEVIRRLMLGDAVTDDIAQKLNNAYLVALLPLTGVETLLSGDIARYLIASRLKGYKDIFVAKTDMDRMLHEILNDHRANFDPENPKDLIDLFLREKKAREDKGDPQVGYFTDNSFISSLIQVYGDGGLTVGALLASYLIVLADKLDVQNMIYDEIVREIGSERRPTYEDRLRLPLVNSVLKELERNFTMFPAITSLQNNCDTTIEGVFVPKGTISIVNFYAIHNDPATYKNPELFNPERFLLDEKTKRPKEDLPILFGVGKRSCAGESLVMTEIFIFLTAIFQHFTLKLSDPENKENVKGGNELKGAFESQIIATLRKESSL